MTEKMEKNVSNTLKVGMVSMMMVDRDVRDPLLLFGV